MLKNPKYSDLTLNKQIYTSIYSLIAHQIVGQVKIRKGIGIDVGAGPGLLSIAMA
jgi:2-polyprenyl-3-methyl-5-hydroxy-6-metoxy-1,4-benzoquinol methylase